MSTSCTWAILLAAGSGTRMLPACGKPKQFLAFRNEPLYMASARTFAACAELRGLVFVFPQGELAERTAEVQRLAADIGLPWRGVAGGAQRQDSVRAALDALPIDCDRVLVHDAARPFASPALVNAVLHRLADRGDNADKPVVGVIPGIAVVDTIKVVADGKVNATLNRAELMAVQTPQGFHRNELAQAHARALENQWSVTDDAGLLERCGHAVAVIAGETRNVKITTPEDLAMLHPVSVPEVRVGYGYDVHRLTDSEGRDARPLKLGGVAMPGNMFVQAHSDGDVLLHALMDALLGCFGGGDIGQAFPDTDPAFCGMNSAVLLDDVRHRAEIASVVPRYVDVTIVAQKPKIGPMREQIRGNIASLLGLPVSSVNVKATTEEGLGFTGQGLGIKAVAVVTATAG